ncbi:MAG TPA: ArsR family transcriptional regulator [Aliidongia sp.]|nr:ArsR family transcriptional regulator [Aliidongia sp.]
MSFADLLQADRRLVILRLLAQSPGSAANSSIIATGLAELGHRISRDLVATELAWLAEQRLVTTETVEAGMKSIVVATLTERGLDVQDGRVTVPGVKRPTP